MFGGIRLESDQQFEAMSRLLNQTELAEGQLRPIERVNELSRWAPLMGLFTCPSPCLIDPVNGVVRGNIKLSNATLRCANITNTVPQAYPRSSGIVPDDRH